uniref:NADH dehydrogenase subunit 6 n=1 Tax=Anisolabididae sp. NS-2016 TaxID=1914569 RepID=A0A1J0M498_9NEOP|nr:NADH dehydrogenase subunit 6 [Anisolabididae sp. NS-2016]
MTMMIILLLSLSIYLFYMMIHPMALGLLLLSQTVLIIMLLGLNSPSFWMSYILFLVFMGGILVLVMYIINLANNETFSVNLNYFMNMTLIYFSMLIIIYYVYLNDLAILHYFKFFANLQNLTLNSLINLYSTPNYIMILFLSLYLFYMLVIISYIIKITEGPLRSI